MPTSTNATIAACNQIHVGDMPVKATHSAKQMGRLTSTGMQARNAKATMAMALAVLCSGCLGAGALAKAGRSGRPTLPGGINIGLMSGPLPTIDHDIALARRLHAKLVRVEVQWSAFAPNGPGKISPGAQIAADRLMADASAAGIRVIAFIDRTPCWASSAPSQLLRGCKPGKLGPANAWPPRDASSFGAFAAWLAKRYGSDLAAIEVWNEPDQSNQDYLAGPNKPQRYAELLRAAYPAIKQADSQVQVLAGSLVGSNGAFMRALYRAGIQGYYDGVAVHFYNLVLASLRAFREVQLANHDYKPLWLDEFGWTSCLPKQRTQEEQACVTPRVQATNIASAFRELARARYVAAATIYKLKDSRGEDFGVINEQGAQKPSFVALSTALGSSLAPTVPVTLRLGLAGHQVLASGTGPVGDYMRLEAFHRGRLRYRAIFTLNRNNGYSIALPRVLGTRGLTVRVYQYWLGASHDAQRSI